MMSSCSRSFGDSQRLTRVLPALKQSVNFRSLALWPPLGPTRSKRSSLGHYWFYSLAPETKRGPEAGTCERHGVSHRKRSQMATWNGGYGDGMLKGGPLLSNKACPWSVLAYSSRSKGVSIFIRQSLHERSVLIRDQTKSTHTLTRSPQIQSASSASATICTPPR